MSFGLRLLACIFIAISTGDLVRGQFAAGPNAVIPLNGETVFDCLTNQMATSTWAQTTNGSDSLLVISFGCILQPPVTPYYSTERVPPGGNICRLIITNVTMQQAGVYTCADGGSPTVTYRSLVTVIDPVASVIIYNQSDVVENDELNISCSIIYTGALPTAPSLRPLPSWTTSPGQIFTSDIYYPSINNVTSVATVTVKRPTVPIFNCSTAFEVHVITGSDPNYNMTAPQDTFMVGSTPHPLPDVQYPVENIRIASTVSPTDNCVYKPETLTCTADANPPAQYKWTDIDDNVLSTSSDLSIATGGQFQCIAYNTIRNKIYNATKSTTTTNCIQPHNVAISGSSCVQNSCSCSANQTTITLNCTAEGNPQPTYQWYDDYGTLDPGSSSIRVDTDGNYSCVASNNYGNNPYHATVSVLVSNCLPRPTTMSTTAPSTMSTETDILIESTITADKSSANDSSCVAIAVPIALGVILFISLVVNTILMMLFIRNQRDKHDAIKRAENILQPETTNPSNGVAYEELRRPTDINLQPSTYEALKPPLYVNN